MDTQPYHAYRLHQVEPGIEMFVYLPLKIHYQGFFWETLETGLTRFSFGTHYRQNRVTIDQLLSRYVQLTDLSEEYLSTVDQHYSNILKGFSVSAVDGAFRFSETTAGKTVPRFSEERTQVLNITFIPDYMKLTTDMSITFPDLPLTEYAIQEFTDIFLKTCQSCNANRQRMKLRMSFYLNDPGHLKLLGFSSPAQAGLLFDHLILWVEAIHLFVFGYLIFTYGEQIRKLYGNETLRYMEEEIWVKSFWGVGIHRTCLTVLPDDHQSPCQA